MFKADGEEINSHLQHSWRILFRSLDLYIKIKMFSVWIDFPLFIYQFLVDDDSFLIKLLLTFLDKKIFASLLSINLITKSVWHAK